MCVYIYIYIYIVIIIVLGRSHAGPPCGGGSGCTPLQSFRQRLNGYLAQRAPSLSLASKLCSSETYVSLEDCVPIKPVPIMLLAKLQRAQTSALEISSCVIQSAAFC